MSERVAKKAKKEAMPEIKYDAAKAYEWKEEDVFKFTGSEFGYAYNVLMQEKAKLLRQLDVLNIFEEKLKAAVEAGTAYEKQLEKKSD